MSSSLDEAGGRGYRSPAAVSMGALDAGLGLTYLAASAAARASRPFARAVPPAGVTWVLEPALRPLVRRGRRVRTAARRQLEHVLDLLVPPIVAAILDRIDLTALVRERVDIERLVATVDLDEVVKQVDIEAIVRRLDLDAIVATVDLDAIVGSVDLDAIAGRLDIDAIVRRLDLDSIVATVDLDAVASRLDIDAIVQRLDLIGLANYVIDGVDLPAIIRQSSASFTSEAVRGVRMQGIEADQAIARVMDRLRPRRHDRPTGSTPRLDGGG